MVSVHIFDFDCMAIILLSAPVEGPPASAPIPGDSLLQNATKCHFHVKSETGSR